MKKVMLFVLLAVLLTVGSVFAQDLGIQVIAGPSTQSTETVNLDDLKIGAEVKIDDWGVLKLTDYQTRNSFYIQGGSYPDSGKEAEYIMLWMDITNISSSAKNYLDGADVKVYFDDSYEFGGWYYQRNLDWSTAAENVLKKENMFSIDPFYQGHYVFGCTIPNFVVNSPAPLKMVISLGGNEITYIIRK